MKRQVSNREICETALASMTTCNYQKVLKYMLDYGTITSMEAFRKLNNTRLSASVYILRVDYGLPIGMDMVSKNGKKYGVYYIEGDE